MEKIIGGVIVLLFICGFIYLKKHKVKKGNVNGGGGSDAPKKDNGENQTT